jgi:hypothetical protein
VLSIGQRLKRLILECGLGVEKSQYKKINIYLNMSGDGGEDQHIFMHMWLKTNKVENILVKF